MIFCESQNEVGCDYELRNPVVNLGRLTLLHPVSNYFSISNAYLILNGLCYQFRITINSKRHVNFEVLTEGYEDNLLGSMARGFSWLIA